VVVEIGEEVTEMARDGVVKAEVERSTYQHVQVVLVLG
jgi:hypothetical protein